MKVFLLKIDLDQSVSLEKASIVVEGLLGDAQRSGISSGLADSDLFISDLGLIGGAMGTALNQNHHHILKRIKGGAVLLCFANRPTDNNYQWLDSMGIHLGPEQLVAKDINFLEDFSFSSLFKQKENEFTYDVIFNKSPGFPFNELATNKSGDKVSIYGSLDEGHIFILPRPKDLNEFVKYFIEKILPTLDVDFIVEDGSVQPIPEEIKNLTMAGQDKIVIKINNEEKLITESIQKKNKLEEQLIGLQQWKDLLWQTGTPLENVVKRFFKDVFSIDLKKTDIDLTGEYKGKELFIEVKGNTGTIDHKKDFRQIHERKFYNAKDPQNTIALLVGNPFRLLPLDKRPPSPDESLFAKTSIPIAETSGIGLVHTKDLFNIVNDVLLDQSINKEKILNALMDSNGIYKYEK